MATIHQISLIKSATAAGRAILTADANTAAPTVVSDGFGISCARELDADGHLNTPPALKIKLQVANGGSAAALVYLWDPLSEAWSLSRSAARIAVASGDTYEFTIPSDGASRVAVRAQAITGNATLTAWAASFADDGRARHRIPSGYPATGVDGVLYTAEDAATGSTPALTDAGTFHAAGWPWGSIGLTVATNAVDVTLHRYDSATGVFRVVASFGIGGTQTAKVGSWSYNFATAENDYLHLEVADVGAAGTVSADVLMFREA